MSHSKQKGGPIQSKKNSIHIYQSWIQRSYRQLYSHSLMSY